MASSVQLSSLKTLTNTVTEQMMTKLLENGAYHNSYTMGIEPKATALGMGIARLFYADSESSH